MEILNYLKRVNGSGHIVEHVGYHESGDYLLRLLFSTTDNPFRQHKYEVEKEYNVVDKSEVDKLERQTCPQRMTGESNIDTWKLLPNGDRTCSYCGSLHPESVISIIKEFGGSVIECSTKSYKWYINRPNVHNAMEGGIKYYRYHDTEEFVQQLNLLLNNIK